MAKPLQKKSSQAQESLARRITRWHRRLANQPSYNKQVVGSKCRGGEQGTGTALRVRRLDTILIRPSFDNLGLPCTFSIGL